MAVKTCPTCTRPVVTPHVYGSGKYALCPSCEYADEVVVPADVAARQAIHGAGDRISWAEARSDILGEWSPADEAAANYVDLVLSDDEDDDA